MADVVYAHDEDGENCDKAVGDINESQMHTTQSQDDYVPPLTRLEKYANSEKVYNRQMVGSLALETLRAVADTPEDIRDTMYIINRAAQDSDVLVRIEVMEHLPHIAMLCHEEREKLHHVIQEYLLPLVVKFLGDTEVQVRKTTHAALIVLMEQGLIDMTTIEEQVCPAILMLTELNNFTDFSAGAVELMSKMATLIGRSATERVFMHRFAALCCDPVFSVRKVCASNFGEFCTVLGTGPTEEFLLPYFVELCSDGIWGVRKACAEVFMSVSCTCTLSTRKKTLAPVFANLLVDSSRCVRISAFQALGPFISTFADLSSCGLAYNQHGELVFLNSEEQELRSNSDEKCDSAVKPSIETSDPVSKPEENTMLVLSDTSYGFTKQSPSVTCKNGDQSSVICYWCDNQTSVVPSTDFRSNIISVNNVSVCTESNLTVERTKVTDTINTVHINTCGKEKIKSNCSENNEVDSRNLGSVIASHFTNTFNGSDNFNSFLYWRVPIPELNVDINLYEDMKLPVVPVEEKPNSDMHCSYSASSSSSADVGLKNMYELDNLSHLEEGTFHNEKAVCNTSLHSKLGTSNITMITNTEKHDTIVNIPNKATSKPVVKIHHFEGGTVSTDMKNIHGKPYNAKKLEHSITDIQESHQIPVVSSSSPTQDIVPQQLIDHFVSMTDPALAQIIDNEITHHCAFSIPAVALTLGRANWNLIKSAYETLASDMQWKVRRTVAASIHEVAVILGEELATKDLVPVFNDFIKDLDEVRIGALKHLADFLKLLRPSERKTYLHRFSDFHFTDNERNWRFREELAEQLLQSVPLFSPKNTLKYITPLAISLLMDKVAAVRQMALNLVTQLVHHVSADINLVKFLLAELAEQFAHNKHWSRRQTFALLCSRFASEQVLVDEHFASDVFPHLLDLSWDPVPNVRLTVARTLATDIIIHSYFSSSESPHHEVLVECLQRLQKDKDRDVRYFASLHTKSANSAGMEFTCVEEQ